MAETTTTENSTDITIYSKEDGTIWEQYPDGTEKQIDGASIDANVSVVRISEQFYILRKFQADQSDYGNDAIGRDMTKRVNEMSDLRNLKDSSAASEFINNLKSKTGVETIQVLDLDNMLSIMGQTVVDDPKIFDTKQNCDTSSENGYIKSMNTNCRYYLNVLEGNDIFVGRSVDNKSEIDNQSSGIYNAVNLRTPDNIKYTVNDNSKNSDLLFTSLAAKSDNFNKDGYLGNFASFHRMHGICETGSDHFSDDDLDKDVSGSYIKKGIGVYVTGWCLDKDRKFYWQENPDNSHKYGLPIAGAYKSCGLTWLILKFNSIDSKGNVTYIHGAVCLETIPTDTAFIYRPEQSLTVASSTEDETYGDMAMYKSSDGGYSYFYSIDEDNVVPSVVSYQSIIGLPFKFLPNTDIRIQENKNVNTDLFGADFTENIIYDMPIAVIRPGYAVTSSSLNSTFEKIAGALYSIYSKDQSLGDVAQSAILSALKNSAYQRFYSFKSDYDTYIQYVNTLCHLFATFTGISGLEVPGMNGVKYANYDDGAIFSDKNLNDQRNSLMQLFGNTKAVYAYYEPSSGISHNFGNSTRTSSLVDQVADISDKAKELKFFSGSGESLNMSMTSSASSLLNLLETGTSIVVGGQNLNLPEYYDNSSSSASFGLKIKLVSPYGDPESIFLYILRPLARLLAFSLPRQFTANGYSSPFIVQAFSKGQFNCQLGIVTSLSITRGGNGGESQSIHHIPTELEVNLEIQDMYEQVVLSNEYASSGLSFLGQSIKSVTELPKAFGLLVNNVGLLDFVASYSGFNLNTPQMDTQYYLLLNMLKNRVSDNISITKNGWRLPKWDRQLSDAFANTVNRAQTFVSG